ncbi:terminase large subunit [Sinorhizobium phage phiM7]|uniref:Terminase DNA packaging enzyme large subunit n=2 Tax=Emdodecavirus TaxID=1980937 RepID=S5MPI9_9CAUD|nr:terminase DNA packaging enzyme large subunit [Sinorhizobium phage phiM12]YP_009601207.1 terminase large subunit [Sinorhizobium phage phiM7]AGR47745.1 terminase DNA packaging enzyme large subunit [Sinorhizobium phage phiM12]AKF12630.1 terminase large subunit [Sinorhizobium phage phiM7]AKF12990.1 terminase large subunit [Sinorhizobium phage phiM19]
MTFQYTTFQLGELIKCANSPLYFIENYVTVSTPDGPTLLKLSEAQKQIINDLEKDRYVAKLMERATGKTTVALAYILHEMLFKYHDRTLGMIANRRDAAWGLMESFRRMFGSVPNWMKPEIRTNNRYQIELENGNQLIAMGSQSETLRGMSISLLYIDEIEYFEKRRSRYVFESLIPVIASSKFAKFLSLSTGRDW